MLHQQRQVQTQRAHEWLQLAQKTQVAFSRLQNLAILDFTFEIYDTILASAPPDPAFAKGRQLGAMMIKLSITYYESWYLVPSYEKAYSKCSITAHVTAYINSCLYVPGTICY
jgi:hypothetical protein